MAKHSVSPYQLKIQALLILYKLAHQRKPEPYDRSWALRFLLAFLCAQASGEDRSPFDAFWKAATRPRNPGEADALAARLRGIEMKRLANEICRSVGEQPKQVQDRFWDELTREAHALRGEKLRIFK